MSAPLRCPCGFETTTLRLLVAHQTDTHGVGIRPPVQVVRDDLTGYDEDAFKRADL